MKYILIIFIFLFFSCTTNKSSNDLTGNYTSTRMDKVERLYYQIGFGVNSSITKTKLLLKKDATFYFETCGIVTSGTWIIKEDLLVLNVEQSKFKNDSLSKIKKPDVTERKDLFQFHIRKNELFAVVTNSDLSKSLLLLKK